MRGGDHRTLTDVHTFGGGAAGDSCVDTAPNKMFNEWWNSSCNEDSPKIVCCKHHTNNKMRRATLKAQ